MNSFPTYAIWSDNLGTWAGGRFSATATTNYEKATDQANRMRTSAPFHCFAVIETWGEGHYDRTMYITLPLLKG